jgi:succinate dehydrogenase / fumarate reductase flavoprotein subunit
LSARDIVARAIYTEILEGRGTSNGAVYLDITHRGADFIKTKLPSMYFQFLEFAEIDITRQKMEVAPTVHYQMGGVRAHPETCETNVAGLYAAGEVACGLHGANRLGGNYLSDILVFGRRAGIAAAAYAKATTLPTVNDGDVASEISRVLKPLSIASGPNPFELKERIAATMWKYVGIVRNEQDLREGLAEIEKIKDDATNVAAKGERAYNQSWIEAIEVGNMLLDCRAIISSAIERRESRGAHTRADYPGKQDSVWLVNIITKQVGGDLVTERVPVPEMPSELKELTRMV